MKTAVIRVFKYARNEGDTRIEIERYFDELYVPKKAFSKNKKVKQPEGEVFMREEIELLVDFWRKNPTLVRLGLVLASETGVRVGELSACKPEDVVMDGKALFIHRTQTSGPREKMGVIRLLLRTGLKRKMALDLLL